MPDVAEAPLLLELLGVAEAAHVREHAVLEAGEEHDGELEALRGVQRHQRDRARCPRRRRVVEVGDERDRLEERLDPREARAGSRRRADAVVGRGADARDRRAARRRRRCRAPRRTRGTRPRAPAGSRSGPAPRSCARPRARRGSRCCSSIASTVRGRRRRRATRSNSLISSSRSRDAAERLAGDAGRRGRRAARRGT